MDRLNDKKDVVFTAACRRLLEIGDDCLADGLGLFHELFLLNTEQFIGAVAHALTNGRERMGYLAIKNVCTAGFRNEQVTILNHILQDQRNQMALAVTMEEDCSLGGWVVLSLLKSGEDEFAYTFLDQFFTDKLTEEFPLGANAPSDIVV